MLKSDSNETIAQLPRYENRLVFEERVMTYAEEYRKTRDSNQHILESDLAELKARVALAETVADKAAALMRTAGLIQKDNVSVVSFHPYIFNELADAIQAREAVFPDRQETI